ncbi:unnamed protein product [Phytophthora fragariaefolia]|uniref:Unnamed protein product n=1 Tax=Phytophthora fragariaefolia TaxID=1490495 RepID=A0A9W6X5F0_9STRA|nr:unnamed protein product [Phytophthora fragariaefolia]
MGMNEGLRAAQAHGVTDLDAVGDMRLAIQQSLGVIICLKESLLTQLSIHRELVARFQSVRYIHFTREYNASVDSLAGETLAAKDAITALTEESKCKLEQLNQIREVIYGESSLEVTQVMRFAETPDESSEASPVEQVPSDQSNDAATESSHGKYCKNAPGTAERPPSAEDVDPLEVQEERHRRVDKAQDEELHWANLKLVLKGESSSLGYKAAREAWKMADRFVLSDDDLLYFLGDNCRWGKRRMNETVLRLVVPTTMVQEVLQSCHDSLEGGHQGIVRTFHQVKADYYWIELYADEEKEPPTATRVFPWERPGRVATPDCVDGFCHPTTEGSEGQRSSLSAASKRPTRTLGEDSNAISAVNDNSEDGPEVVEDVNEEVGESPQHRHRPGRPGRPDSIRRKRSQRDGNPLRLTIATTVFLLGYPTCVPLQAFATLWFWFPKWQF